MAETAIVVGDRKELTYLLSQAAELEHGLMCEYLYAAFSLKSTAGPGLRADQLESVGRWREIILRIAAQEMMHWAMGELIPRSRHQHHRSPVPGQQFCLCRGFGGQQPDRLQGKLTDNDADRLGTSCSAGPAQLRRAVSHHAGIPVIRSAVQAPRMNSIMERWIGSCRRELLDRTLVWNQRHLRVWPFLV